MDNGDGRTAVSMPRSIPRSMLGCAGCAECAGLPDVSGSVQTRPESTDLPDARRGIPFGRFWDPVREHAWIGQSDEDGCSQWNRLVEWVVEASEVRQLFLFFSHVNRCQRCQVVSPAAVCSFPSGRSQRVVNRGEPVPGKSSCLHNTAWTAKCGKHFCDLSSVVP
jgi:hypothetical protein